MSDSTPKSFGLLLRRFRRAAELTQEELAQRSDLSTRTISDLERGVKATPQAGTLELLAAALELSDEDRALLLGSVPRRRRQPAATETGGQLPALPADLTPLVGRERDEAAAIHLLHTNGVRELTLIGPGGVGKTRLALRVARTVAAEYSDGVAFVALDAIGDHTQVAGAIARTLGAITDRKVSTTDGLVKWLGSREMLLLLDNFEQVIPAAVLVSELLSSCPRLTFLVTSRAPLHIRAEQLLDVPPLDSPALTEKPSARAALGYSAVALFVQRSRAVRPDFELTEDEVKPVSQICQRLDNLPLALELAAAHMRHTSSVALLERLEKSPGAEPPGPVDAPQRQRTMKSTIAWSYDLLDEPEQRFFRRLSIFVGGFTLSAADNVSGLPNSDTLSLLRALSDNCLVFVRIDNNAEPRFFMLETVREYCIEMAHQHDNVERLRWRHAEYFSQLAQQAAIDERKSGTGPWQARLLADHANVLAALGWLADSGRLREALDLAGAMGEYWTLWGFIREGREWVDQLLEEVDRLSEETVDIPASALMCAAQLAFQQNDYKRAASLYARGVEAFHSDGDTRGETIGLSQLGTVAHLQNDYSQAKIYYERAVQVAREHGHGYGMAMPLTNLGIVAMQEAEYDRAAMLLDEAIEMLRGLGLEQKLAVALGNCGNLEFRRGRYDEAVVIHEEVLAMKRAIGDSLAVGHTLGGLALAEIERGDDARAEELLSEALVIFDDIDKKDGIAQVLEALARIAQDRDQLERAARLYGGAAALQAEIGVTHHPADLDRYQKKIDDLRNALGSRRFDMSWRVGEAMSYEELIRDAAPSGRVLDIA